METHTSEEFETYFALVARYIKLRCLQDWSKTTVAGDDLASISVLRIPVLGRLDEEGDVDVQRFKVKPSLANATTPIIQ
jgi:hypothetical protein